jgi:hypothetical protein
MPPSLSPQCAEAPCNAPGVTRSIRRAAMRVSGVVQTPGPKPVLPPMSPPHAPCSPSIGAVAWPPTLLSTPVDLLRHPFTPYRVAPAGLLSVAGLRHTGVDPPCAPTCCFVGQSSTSRWARSREVPLEMNSSGGLSRAVSLYYTMPNSGHTAWYDEVGYTP